MHTHTQLCLLPCTSDVGPVCRRLPWPQQTSCLTPHPALNAPLNTLAPPLHLPSQLDFQPGQGDYRVYIVNLNLAMGASYFMRIYATNGAGLEGFR